MVEVLEDLLDSLDMVEAQVEEEGLGDQEEDPGEETGQEAGVAQEGYLGMVTQDLEEVAVDLKEAEEETQLDMGGTLVDPGVAQEEGATVLEEEMAEEIVCQDMVAAQAVDQEVDQEEDPEVIQEEEDLEVKPVMVETLVCRLEDLVALEVDLGVFLQMEENK